MKKNAALHNDGNDQLSSLSIFNLDSIEQIQLWMSLGPKKATELILSQVKMGILLAKNIFIDTNQLFTSVFFVEITPEKLTWHLGLPPGSKLPIIVSGASDCTDLLANRKKATENDGFATMYHAFVDERCEAKNAAVQETKGLARYFFLAEQSEKWRDVENKPDCATVWPIKQRKNAKEIFDKAHDKWCEAAKNNIIEFRTRKTGRLDLGDSMDFWKPKVGANGELPELMQLLINYLPGVDRRVAMVKLLNKESYSDIDLEERKINTEEFTRIFREKEYSYDEIKTAFRWWNLAYNDAIAKRDGVSSLNLIHSLNDDSQLSPYDKQWGLDLQRSSFFSRVKSSLFGQEQGQGISGIGGAVISKIELLSPAEFCQLNKCYSEKNDFNKKTTVINDLTSSILNIIDRNVLYQKPRKLKTILENAFVIGIALFTISDEYEMLNFLPNQIFFILFLLTVLPFDKLASVYGAWKNKKNTIIIRRR